jgi:hypothetical protein
VADFSKNNHGAPYLLQLFVFFVVKQKKFILKEKAPRFAVKQNKRCHFGLSGRWRRIISHGLTAESAGPAARSRTPQRMITFIIVRCGAISDSSRPSGGRRCLRLLARPHTASVDRVNHRANAGAYKTAGNGAAFAANYKTDTGSGGRTGGSGRRINPSVGRGGTAASQQHQQQ